jgi:hypothetical protein
MARPIGSTDLASQQEPMSRVASELVVDSPDEAGDLLQQQLAHEFGRLRAGRPRDFAVFGLEHGFDQAMLEVVRKVIRAEAGDRLRREAHSLLWVAHASEMAYRYDGDEYWTSFEADLPRWHYGYRVWLRDTFARFAAEYGGPIPSGAWAAHFSLICWPITNAILPADLQRHIARALFLARDHLAGSFDSVEDLGHAIVRGGWHGSSRFQTFIEQPRLLGHIAFALLGREPEKSLLRADTLRRIADDLKRERSSARWLDGARKKFDRSRVRVVGGSSAPAERGVGISESQARTRRPEIVFFRRNDSWRAFLDLPSLDPVLRDGETRLALLKSQARVPFSGAVIPREGLVRGYQVPIARWPRDGEAMIEFDGLASGLESVLLRAWAFPAGLKLFHVGHDGVARLVAGRVVRPSRTYLVVSTNPIMGLESAARPFVHGGFLYEFALGPAVPDILARLLTQLGFSLLANLDVAPAVVAPLSWTVDSAAEWLTRDAPILSFTPGRDLALLEVGIEGRGTAKKAGLPAGEPAYVQVPALEAGMYRLDVREVPQRGDPLAWSMTWSTRERSDPQRSGTGPIRLWVEPFTQSLEDLWDGRSSLLIEGNRGDALVTLLLAQRLLVAVSASRSVAVQLPITRDSWAAVMSDFRDDTAVARAYDDARVGRVEVDVGRFGRYMVEFERTVQRLRWRFDVRSRIATLVDDGELLPATVEFLSFDSPIQPVALTLRPDRTIDVDPAGGLLRAECGLMSASQLVAPRTRTFKDFVDLRSLARATHVENSVPGISRLLRRRQEWSRASLPGDLLAAHRRRQVEVFLDDLLFRSIAGNQFADRESLPLGEVRRLLPQSASLLSQDINAAFRIIALNPAADGARVRTAIENLYRHAHIHVPDRTWRRVMGERGADAKGWIASFCQQLAIDPMRVVDWGGLELALELVLAWSTPYKVARVLTRDRPRGAITVGVS